MPQLLEGPQLLLTQLAEIDDAEDVAMPLTITGERRAMMRRMQLSANATPSAPELPHGATATFERALWLIRSPVAPEEMAGESA